MTQAGPRAQKSQESARTPHQHRARARRATPREAVPERPAGEATEGDPALWAAVRALPPKQRDAVLLRYVNDLPHADIGTVLGCSEEAARRNVHEGVKKLRSTEMEEWSA